MAITVGSLQNSAPATRALTLEDGAALRPAPRDLTTSPTQTTPTPGVDATKDVVGTSPSTEVSALRDQLAASTSRDDVATHARRDVTNLDGGGIQIGARVRVATEGITNVGNAKGAATGQ